MKKQRVSYAKWDDKRHYPLDDIALAGVAIAMHTNFTG